VPIFQRNYKWNQVEHWEPLWADIRDVAEDVLDFGDGPDVGDHFLGAIVCEQQSVYGLDAQAIALIDGQQRLTTLQLLLAGALRVAARREPVHEAYIRDLVENNPAVVKGRADHVYKVRPNVADREGFAAAMEGRNGKTGPELAARYFEQAIDRWLDIGIGDDPLDDADNTPSERMTALVSALARRVKIVKIDLEAADNAQVIFETLNARGERLTDSDLIRNYLFRLAEEQSVDAEDLHSRCWRQFDTKAWGAPIAHGRHQRDRLSLFLNHWLSMRSLEEVPASAIFRKFKAYVESGRKTGLSGLPRPTAEAVAQDIRRYGGVFDSFDLFQADSPEWWFFRRLQEMDLITVYPVLLWLFGQDEADLPVANRRRALVAIESFLARRLVRRDTTRSYGDLFVRVLQVAGAGEVAGADARIIELLASNTAEADIWPTDDDIRSAVLNTNVYKIKQSRLKMILEALERHSVSDGRTEAMSLGHDLWIEHLLPQTWRNTSGWSLPADVADPTQASLDRDHILHTLGNLTLTTSKLDIELSNRPWSEKVIEIQKHSSLAINRDLLVRYPDRWGEATIRERGARLPEDMLSIWPGPLSLTRMAASEI
jgi:hypothetical protein